jgi:hypothetical protein
LRRFSGAAASAYSRCEELEPVRGVVSSSHEGDKSFKTRRGGRTLAGRSNASPQCRDRSPDERCPPNVILSGNADETRIF